MNEKRFVRVKNKSHFFWAEKTSDCLEILSRAPWMADSKKTGEVIEKTSWGDLEYQPCAEPTKIIAFGYNYKDLFKDKAARVCTDEPHYSDKEFEPVIFLKAPNALSPHLGQVAISEKLSEVWVEVELALVIGRQSKNIKNESEAREALFGYTVANDISALNIYGRDWHLARSKSIDGFCPIGPELVQGLDFEDKVLSLSINGNKTQNSRTSNRVLNSLQSLIFVSQFMTLEPGDVILTGTPLGARQSLVKPGDTVEATIEGLGTLNTRFVSDRRDLENV